MGASQHLSLASDMAAHRFRSGQVTGSTGVDAYIQGGGKVEGGGIGEGRQRRTENDAQTMYIIVMVACVFLGHRYDLHKVYHHLGEEEEEEGIRWVTCSTVGVPIDLDSRRNETPLSRFGRYPYLYVLVVVVVFVVVHVVAEVVSVDCRT